MNYFIVHAKLSEVARRAILIETGSMPDAEVLFDLAEASPGEREELLDACGSQQHLCFEGKKLTVDGPTLPDILRAIRQERWAAGERDYRRAEHHREGELRIQKDREEDLRAYELWEQRANALCAEAESDLSRARLENSTLFVDGSSLPRTSPTRSRDHMAALIDSPLGERIGNIKDRLASRELATHALINACVTAGMIATYADDEQRQRASVGVLPLAELTQKAEAEAFSPIEGWEAYQLITHLELLRDCGERDGSTPSYTNKPVTRMSSALFAQLLQLHRLLPTSTIALMHHHGEVDCGNKHHPYHEVSRLAWHVTIVSCLGTWTRKLATCPEGQLAKEEDV